MELIHYIFVRRDLPLGICAAMIAHAAGESSVFYKDAFGVGFTHAIAVVLEAKNEAHLLKIEECLHSSALRDDPGYITVTESGGAYDGQLMAIGMVPAERSIFDNRLKDYQTLKQLDKLDETA